MVAAGDELRSVLKRDLISGLTRRPLGEYLSPYETPICTLPRCAMNRISRSRFSNRFVGAVCHQDWCLGGDAKDALVLTTPIRVDAPLEGHSLHAIENGLHLDLNPLDIRQNSRTRRLEETRLRRNGNKISIGCRKKFRLQGHALNDIYEHTFVSMPNTGVLDKAPRNATNFVPGAPFSLTSFSYPWRVASYTGHRGKQVPIRPPNADVSGPWKKHRTRRSTGCWRACYLLWR